MRTRLQPALTRPADFSAFWRKTVIELELVDPEVYRTPVEDETDVSLVLEKVSFCSFGGARVHGYVLRSRETQPRPLVVHSHGYQGCCEVMWEWARTGVNVCGVDIRGFGRSRDALAEISPWGYVLTGIDSPESYILRAAVCDYLRAIQVARTLVGPDIVRTIYVGSSFAGGLALMAAAVAPGADLLAVGVPTFGWAEGRQFFVRLGSGKEINDYLARRPEAVEDVMVVLRYFDPINFAPAVSCPSLVGMGIVDEVVPAHTVYAVANHLAGPHEVMEFPISHSDSPEQQHWKKFEAYWLRLAREGVSDDFGGRLGRRIHRISD